MTISISAQSDRILEDAVSSGLFKDKQEAISAAIRLLSEKANESDSTSLTGNAWKERFRHHVADTPVSEATLVDDSRESIYEGRGL